MKDKNSSANSNSEKKIQHIRNENLYLSRSILLEETGSSIIIRQIVMFIVAVIIALLFILSIAF